MSATFSYEIPSAAAPAAIAVAMPNASPASNPDFRFRALLHCLVQRLLEQANTAPRRQPLVRSSPFSIRPLCRIALPPAAQPAPVWSASTDIFRPGGVVRVEHASDLALRYIEGAGKPAIRDPGLAPPFVERRLERGLHQRDDQGSGELFPSGRSSRNRPRTKLDSIFVPSLTARRGGHCSRNLLTRPGAICGDNPSAHVDSIRRQT